MRRFRILGCCILALACFGCASADRPASTPTEALRMYVEAQQRGDVAAMKRLLSKSSIEFIDKAARAQNKSVDDVLREETKIKVGSLPVTRNEKVEGETATVEVRDDRTGNYDLVYPFVREDGAWKLARDKQIESMLKQANEAREKMVTDVANESRSNTNR